MTTYLDELKSKVSSLFEECQRLRGEKDECAAEKEELQYQNSELLDTLRKISKQLLTADNRIDDKALNDLQAKLAAPDFGSDNWFNYYAKLLDLYEQNKTLRQQLILVYDRHANLYLQYQELTTGQGGSSVTKKDYLIARLKKQVKDSQKALNLTDEKMVEDYYQLKNQRDTLQELNKDYEAKLHKLEKAVEERSKQYESRYFKLLDRVEEFVARIKRETHENEQKTRQMDVRLQALDLCIQEFGKLEAYRTIGENILVHYKQQKDELTYMARVGKVDAFDKREAEKRYKMLLSKTEKLSQYASLMMKRLNEVVIDAVRAGVYDALYTSK